MDCDVRNWLSGFFHGQFFVGIVRVCLSFSACENFEFAKRAKDKLNHISRAAFIVVVRAWANATDQANPRALLDHVLNPGDNVGRENSNAMPVSMNKDGV
jgi:hypothetical protein